MKCDVRKYFFNINNDIIYRLISRKIKDKKVLELTKEFIYHNEDSVGVPIGNYTSQYYANIYLNELDKYVKHELKLKYFVRYMDDWVILFKTKEEAKEALQKITIFLREELKLELNSKTNYFQVNQGASFCGYRIWPTHMLLRDQSKKRMKRRMKIFQKLYRDNRITIEEITKSVMSWWGHVIHCNSHMLICRIFDQYRFSRSK